MTAFIDTFRTEATKVYNAAHQAWGSGKIKLEKLEHISAQIANLDYLSRKSKRKTNDSEIMERLANIQ